MANGRQKLWLYFVGCILATALEVRSERDCVTPPQIAKVYAKEKDVIVVAQLDSINTVKKAQATLRPVADFVRKCHADWGEDWGVAFVTEEKYAGNKDEVDPRYLEDGSWQRASIGNYERKTQKLWLTPLNPKTKKWILVPLGR